MYTLPTIFGEEPDLFASARPLLHRVPSPKMLGSCHCGSGAGRYEYFWRSRQSLGTDSRGGAHHDGAERRRDNRRKSLRVSSDYRSGDLVGCAARQVSISPAAAVAASSHAYHSVRDSSSSLRKGTRMTQTGVGFWSLGLISISGLRTSWAAAASASGKEGTSCKLMFREIF